MGGDSRCPGKNTGSGHSRCRRRVFSLMGPETDSVPLEQVAMLVETLVPFQELPHGNIFEYCLHVGLDVDRILDHCYLTGPWCA